MKESEPIDRKADGRLGAATSLGVMDKMLNKIEGSLLALEEGECTYQSRLADLRIQNPHLRVLRGTETARLDAQTPCLALGYLPGREQTRCVRLREMCKRWRNLILRRARLGHVFSWGVMTPNIYVSVETNGYCQSWNKP